MKIEGFTYVRNGLKMGYPFIASIQSLLPIVSKLIVVLGDSDDGSREAIENLKNEKIVIVDNVWKQDDIDPGEIFREQSNIGIDHLSGDWAIHLQADEVLKDSDHIEILKYIKILREQNYAAFIALLGLFEDSTAYCPDKSCLIVLCCHLQRLWC